MAKKIFKELAGWVIPVAICIGVYHMGFNHGYDQAFDDCIEVIKETYNSYNSKED